MTRAIICDLDGTLCLFGDRPPYDRDYENDTVNEAVADIIANVFHCNDTEAGEYTEIIFVTGRMEKSRKVTEEWITSRFNEDYLLFMRKDGDTRKDVIVKREIYDAYIKDKYNVLYALDDRNQVVDLWRKELGITCLQVNYGDF